MKKTLFLSIIAMLILTSSTNLFAGSSPQSESIIAEYYSTDSEQTLSQDRATTPRGQTKPMKSRNGSSNKNGRAGKRVVDRSKPARR